jgi:hypothetical protein
MGEGENEVNNVIKMIAKEKEKDRVYIASGLGSTECEEEAKCGCCGANNAV